MLFVELADITQESVATGQSSYGWYQYLSVLKYSLSSEMISPNNGDRDTYFESTTRFSMSVDRHYNCVKRVQIFLTTGRVVCDSHSPPLEKILGRTAGIWSGKLGHKSSADRSTRRGRL